MNWNIDEYEKLSLKHREKKKIENTGKCIKDIWSKVYRPNICIIAAPDGEERDNGVEKCLKNQQLTIFQNW